MMSIVRGLDKETRRKVANALRPHVAASTSQIAEAYDEESFD